MVPLLLMPTSATQQLSSSSLPDRTTAQTAAEEADSTSTENVSGVHYQLGRRDLDSSDYKRNSKSFHYWGSSESTMTTSVTMAVGMGIMFLFLLVNVTAIEAAAESHNKYSFNSSNSVFMSHQPQQQQPATTYSHRLKGLDRILNRLDGNRGDSNNGYTGNTKVIKSYNYLAVTLKFFLQLAQP